ncbi:MAG: M23 family metallopeptidase [Rickettsiales bacterium]|nr:M23 family metallopeptidase [Rickettsiales bacterium]
MKRRLFVIFALITSPALSDCNIRGVESDAPVLCGNAIQGGFLYGETDWAITVPCRGGFLSVAQNGGFPVCRSVVAEDMAPEIDKNMKNGWDGLFIIDLGMDAPEKITLDFYKNGKWRSFDYMIKRRKYPEQHIKVSKKFIEYPPEIQARIDGENDSIIGVRERIDYSFAEFMDWKYPFSKKYPTSGVYGARRIFNGEPRSPHKGWDIAAPKGTPVRSIGQGIVVLTINAYMSGKTVLVSHGYGLFSLYAHLDRINVKFGDIVSFDSIVGTVGATGRASGPHLHLGLYFKQTPIDPELLF